MRKTLIAATVATALFAVGAFAASFTTGAEDTASGSNAVQSCADSATITFAETFDNVDNNWDVGSATVLLVGGSDCDGAEVQLVLQDNDGLETIVYDNTKANVQHGANGVTIATGNMSLVYSSVNVAVGDVWNAAVLVDGKQLTTT